MAVKDDYQDFKNALNDLKINNKASINFLTLLAEDKIHNAQQIVRAIEERILETKGDYVLPSLYVLDSIVKNLRSSTYIQLFENKLPVIFASAFNKVDERTRLAMFKLRQTWPPFFSNTVLHNLDTRTHYIDPAWPITARTPDTSPSVPKIHINPDFIQRNPTSSTSSSINSGKSDETIRSIKEDNNYHMIPIDRKEIETSSTKNSNDEQQTKIKQDNEKSSEHEEDVLFGGSDIDYRDTDVSQTSSIVPNSDTDRLFKLNSECLSLAEEKFKSKELSSEEYQATLKLLQTILQNEVQRLTIPSTNPVNNNSTSFSNSSLSFPSTTTTTSPNFPFAGFGNDTQRHALQILAAVNASSPYALPYNFLPYIPPLPPAPAPPPFTLLPSTFSSSTTSTDRLSPNKKRTPDDNSNSTIHSDQTIKRQRRNSSTINNHGHNFDEENIAPVPSLIDANINTLKKKYLGVIQQLYIGKYQCRLCGLRFTAKQKHVYTHHLDWHYWENRQAATNQTNVLERCRDWYPSLQDWIIHEENLDEQNKNNQMMLTQNRQNKEIDKTNVDSNDIISCTAKGDGDVDNDRCHVCRDPFENFFDDNREEWRLKDAIRVDGKTYHPICYQDVKFHDTNYKSSTLSTTRTNDTFQLSESLIDETSNQSSDSQLVDNVLSIVNIKSETEDTNDKESLSSPEESSKADYVSSMSFVNLVETIFIKKEDLKPIENFNVKNELLNPSTISEDIPFLSIKPESDCEFFNNQTSSDQIRSITE